MSKYTKEAYDALKYGARAFTALTKIFSNEKFRKSAKGKARDEWASFMVEYEPDAVIELIAAHRRIDPDVLEANMTPLTYMVGIMEVMNDPEMESLFTSAGQKTADESSGSPTENTEATEKT